MAAKAKNPRKGLRKPAAKAETPPKGDHSPDSLAEPADHLVPVVGIGASAGGFDAIKKLIGSLPEDTGMACVIIQHMDPKHETHLPSLLSPLTKLQVFLAENAMAVCPNCIYAAPSSGYIALRRNRLYRSEAALQAGRRMPIDHLFRSLAQERGDRAVGIVLSGTGSDGTEGIRAIRRAGGLTLVQEPSTAEYPDMPASAFATGAVDASLPVEEMASFIANRARRVVAAIPEMPPEMKPEDLNVVLAQVLARTQCDFRGYKQSTLYRRIYRRMALHQIDHVHHYIEYLRRNPDEVAELRNDLLIGVTGFFREAEAFEEFRKEVVVPLVAAKKVDEPIRVWSAGCASGEEAYSIAMLFVEEMQRVDKHMPLQVFASDIDQSALQVARNGQYPKDIKDEISPERLERFFAPVAGGYAVNKNIREPIVFSVQNLITDPPFSKLDIISCRNVLIYLQGDVQKRAITLFAFALRRQGHLFLGKSDSIAGRDDLFELWNKKGRLFRRRATARPDVGALPAARTQERPPAGGIAETLRALPRPALLALINQNVLLETFNAAVVLADTRGKILHFFGDAGKYLTLPPGEADLDLLKMARDKLGLKLRPAIHKALQGQDDVRLERVPVRRNGDTMLVEAIIRVLHPEGWGEPLVAAIFRETGSPQPSPAAGQTMDESAAVRELESELAAVKDELQSTYEEFESSNEELKAANEEMMSMNEELQSANEELETSKEELQSINEELTTVNNQLNEKLDELGEVNDDLANLLNATDVATVFLDTQLRIKRFTPQATQLLNLIPADIGRPIEHIAPKFRDGRLVEQARQTLKTLAGQEHEIRSEEDGNWYILRMVPYRTVDNRIDGVVMTFADVTGLKLAERLADSIVQTVRHPLAVLDADLRVRAANSAFKKLLRLENEEAEGKLLYRLADRQLDVEELRKLLEEIIPRDTVVEGFELSVHMKDGRTQPVVVNARRIEKQPGRPHMILLAMEEAKPKK